MMPPLDQLVGALMPMDTTIVRLIHSSTIAPIEALGVHARGIHQFPERWPNHLVAC